MRWEHPFSAIVAGPSGCSKSQFVSKFIQHITEMCDTPFFRINWHYGRGAGGSDSINTNINQMVINLVEGLPNLEVITRDELQVLTNVTKVCFYYAESVPPGAMAT